MSESQEQVGSDSEAATPNPARLGWYRILCVVIAGSGTHNVVKTELWAALGVEGRRLIPLILGLVAVAAGVALFVYFLVGKRLWTAMFAVTAGSCIGALIGVFAYPEPALWKFGVYWLGPFLWAGFAYFWEWRTDRDSG